MYSIYYYYYHYYCYSYYYLLFIMDKVILSTMVIYIYILLYTFICYLYSQWICKCYALEHSTPEPAFCIEAN